MGKPLVWDTSKMAESISLVWQTVLGHGPNPTPNPPPPPPQIDSDRFGRVLAAIRTKHRAELKRKAKQFLKEAMANPGQADCRPKANQLWIAGADLKPVISYLST